MSDDKVLVSRETLFRWANGGNLEALMHAEEMRALLAQNSDGALANEGAESVVPAPAFDDAVERAAFEGWYRDQLFWPNEKVFNAAGGAWLACARRHPPKVCTCPSGDGSLRWPCPMHPPEVKVVLPEHHCDRCDSSEAESYQNGWNACLDRVKELNS